MDLGKIPTIAVGLAVAIIVVSAIAVPIISGLGEEIKTDLQNNTERYTVCSYGDLDNFTFEIKEDGIYINNNKMDFQESYTIITDKGMIRTKSTELTHAANVYYEGCKGDGESITKATITNKELFVTETTGDKSLGSVNLLLYPNKTGDYGFFGNNFFAGGKEPVYIFATGNVNNDSLSPTMQKIACIIESSSDGKTKNPILSLSTKGSEDKLVADVIIASNNPIQTEAGYYEWGPKSSFVNSAEYSRNYYNVIAPIEYSYLTSDDSAAKAIVDVIPMLLIISLMVGCVGSIIIKNKN